MGRRGQPWKFFKAYCLPPDAPVWMADLTFKSISKVKSGDLVFGWEQKPGHRRRFKPTKVLRTSSRRAELVEVELASGATIRCTKDHLWATAREKRDRGQEWTTVLPPKIERSPDGTFAVGSNAWRPCLAHVVDVVALQEYTSTSYSRGYFHGALDGDGTVRDDWYLSPTKTAASRVLSVLLRVQDEEFARRFEVVAQRLGLHPTQTRRGRFFCVDLAMAGVDEYYKPRRGNDAYWRGYLAGVYDAEGYGFSFAQYKSRNPAVYDNISKALRRFNFRVREGKRDIFFLGGRNEFVRFWNLVRPAVQRKAVGINQGPNKEGVFSTWGRDEVLSVRSLGTRKVYCLTTETGNFVAYGYASHNCDYQTDEYGWTADGTTERAKTELVKRLNLVKIQRPRDVIWANTPPKTRTVIRLDVDAPDEETGLKSIRKERTEGSLFAALERTLDLKMDDICESVIDGLGAGEKAVVWCLTRASVESLTEALEKAINNRQVATLMRQQKVRLWATHGEADVKARNQLAATFREHQGACVLVATMDSMPESISLAGAHTEHFAQLHHLPGAMFQAENRPYHIDVRGLSIIYYIAKKTVDERVERLVLPRVEMLEKLAGESDAIGMRAAFEKGEKKETLADFIARLCDDMPEDGRAGFGDDSDEPTDVD